MSIFVYNILFIRLKNFRKIDEVTQKLAGTLNIVNIGPMNLYFISKIDLYQNIAKFYFAKTLFFNKLIKKGTLLSNSNSKALLIDNYIIIICISYINGQPFC